MEEWASLRQMLRGGEGVPPVTGQGQQGYFCKSNPLLLLRWHKYVGTVMEP